MSLSRARLLSVALFVSAVLVLVIAHWLTPSPDGVGTHTQLGLEPCIMLSKMGLPCPMCGMTTTFSLMAHLRPVDALLNQPFGVILYIGTVLIAWIAALEIVFPKDRWQVIVDWSDGREVALVVALSAIMFGSWVYKIALVTQKLS